MVKSFVPLRAIQIIRDTQGGGGGKTKCHVNFLTVLKSDFKAFGSTKRKGMFLRTELGLKRHFHSTTFFCLKPISLLNQLFLTQNITWGGGGGVRKVPKKCHVLFEGSLSDYMNRLRLEY